MDKPLRVLIIEDSHGDVVLQVLALEEAGYRVTYTVAATAAEMKAALAEEPFDIVLSDHNLPQFDAPGALAVLKQSGLDIPFIIVSGAIGEEAAVALLKAGAHDYVMKDRLTRLASAVEHALQDAEDRRERRQAEGLLRASEEKYRALVENISDVLYTLDTRGNITYISPSVERFTGYKASDLIGKPFTPLIYPDDLPGLADSFKRLASGQLDPWEFRVLDKGGRIIFVRTSSQPIYEDGQIMGFTSLMTDITQHKTAEEKLEKGYESLKKTLNDAIDTMVKIVELRDPYTAGHQQKVADLATAIAREMNLEDTRIDQIRMAAIIHDIGKMNVPSDILSKPGKLSDIEFSLIKTHSQYGYDIVKGMDFACNVAQTVLQHHERLDGSGYPNHLKGVDTLLEAKILVVADVVEAMASNRPYRAALGIDKALEEISSNRGKIYDADVVDTCLELFNSGKFEFIPV